MPVLVEIAKPFTLLRDDGTYKKFHPGPQHLMDDEAEHWYVRLHLVDSVGIGADAVPGSNVHAAALQKQNAEVMERTRLEYEAKQLIAQAAQQAQHDAMVKELNNNAPTQAKASKRVALKVKAR